MEGDNGDDRISNLPNDILVNILDRLNVRDASRTSVLSRRWCQLPAMLSRLTISAQDFWHPRNSMSDDEFLRINAAVAEATKSILARRDPGGCTICLLSTTFYLRDDIPISVGHTVGNAMATHKIEKVEFTVLTQKAVECTVDDLLNYGTQFVSFFNECLNVFARLTRLHLENLRFAESDFASNILVTSAPSLEELYMTVMDHHCEMQMDKEKRREGLYSENKGVEWKSPNPNFKHHRLPAL
ncbi:hypothetical protein QYE76_040454 [Lolium multiflorum]|uniref:F-box domain-containing protein n=1 Tax=Lolium multiflorum TaxID=4521 RepID=A0AAD8WUX9_LOLMU|nr:hypothetical protein QYE76_040454 [Lolium multiflorum]